MLRTKKSVEEAIAEVLEKAKAFTEAHQGEDMEEILAEMRGEPLQDTCEGCNNYKGCVYCVEGDQWAKITEASDEKENFINAIINSLDKAKLNRVWGITLDEVKGWLEKQGKLPVSDIDEQMISKIKFAVSQMSSERQDTKKECLNWLENLRKRL